MIFEINLYSIKKLTTFTINYLVLTFLAIKGKTVFRKYFK